jgi:hypothetical protein
MLPGEEAEDFHGIHTAGELAAVLLDFCEQFRVLLLLVQFNGGGEIPVQFLQRIPVRESAFKLGGFLQHSRALLGGLLPKVGLAGGFFQFVETLAFVRNVKDTLLGWPAVQQGR